MPEETRRNSLFNIKGSAQGIAQANAQAPFRSKFLATHFQKLENLERDLIRLPTKDEFIFLQSAAQFNAFTFIPFIARPYHIEHLYATTYSISARVIEAMMELYDSGMIAAITLCISDSMIKRNPKVIDNLMAMSSTRGNVSILFGWVHAKVALAQTEEHHFVIEGSGNWSENAKYEQYLMANSRGLFEFRQELFALTSIRWKVVDGKLEKVN